MNLDWFILSIRIPHRFLTRLDVVLIISNVQRKVLNNNFVFFLSLSFYFLIYFLSFDSNLGLDHHQSFIDHCSSSYCWFYSLSVRCQIEEQNECSSLSRRAKFEAELKAMQWLIKWEELTTRTLLHNGVATPSFNKLSASQKVKMNFFSSFNFKSIR